MKDTNILICGVGGQGLLLASNIIAGVSCASLCDVKVFEVHGMAQRGGSVTTFVRIADKVLSPAIEPGEADFLLAFEQLEAARYLHYLKPGGTAIINTCKILPSGISELAGYPQDIDEKFSEIDAQIIDATEIACKMQLPRSTNIVMLGAFARYLPFDKDVWICQIKKFLPPNSHEANIKAFLLTYEG